MKEIMQFASIHLSKPPSSIRNFPTRMLLYSPPPKSSYPIPPPRPLSLYIFNIQGRTQTFYIMGQKLKFNLKKNLILMKISQYTTAIVIDLFL